MCNFFEIMFNERTNKFSLWMNGRIIKMAARESTLIEEVKRRGGKLEGEHE